MEKAPEKKGSTSSLLDIKPYDDSSNSASKQKKDKSWSKKRVQLVNQV